MKEITSLSNNTVKEVVKLHQKKNRDEYIIIEGKKALDGAIEAGFKVWGIFSPHLNILETMEKYDTYLVNEKIMSKISTTESAPNVLAVIERPKYDINKFKGFKKIILLDEIKDSGNLGTIIRTAAAFDIDGIMLFGECTDEFSPKTIRSAAGNVFKTPVVHCTLGELKDFKKTHKMVSTVVNSKNSIRSFTPKEPCIVMFGSEANGLCNDLLTLCDDSYTIPMKSGVESLNLAVSAGIVLYEIFRHQI